MDSRDFCFWLRGFFEISGNTTLNKDQAKVVKEHLDKVFLKSQPIVLNDIKDYTGFNYDLQGSC